MNWKINGLSFVAALLTIGCEDSKQSKLKSTEYASVENLTEIHELVSLGQRWKLIDLRKPEEFKKGHIPGALNVWRTDLADTSFTYGGMMPTQFQMELLLSRLGISPTDTIVIYDHKAQCDAARLWWVLKVYGHENIKLLNGGLTTWNALGNELSINTEVSDTTAYRFHLQPDSSLLALIEAIELMPDSNLLLLDTRGKEEYSGGVHKNGASHAGHINGAINFDWAMAVDYHGTQKFLSAEELKTRYAVIGIDGTKPVITYCHSGVRSAHTLFVLTELLGYRNIRNYDGSWIEWSHLHNE